jgi:diacylglycerol kinase
VIEAEGGLRLGLRASSTIHVHLFVASAVGVAAFVLELSFLEWLLLLAAFAATLAAELWHLAITTLAEAAQPSPPALRRVLRLSTAATLCTVGGATAVALGAVLRRVWTLFAA